MAEADPPVRTVSLGTGVAAVDAAAWDALFGGGNPFIGHHREYTLSEFQALPGMLGLEPVEVFAVNAAYESRKPKSAAQEFLIGLEERHGLGDRLLPPTWRKHVWLDARRRG